MKIDVMKRKWHSKVQIKGEVKTILGEDVYYRLYEMKCPCIKRYFINISKGRESVTCDFGKDKNAAADAFKKIVEFTVTPCTLKYVSEDFITQQKTIKLH